MDHPTRWVLLPFIWEERGRRVPHPPPPQTKIYNVHETITAEYWKFQKQPKTSNFLWSFSKQSFHLPPGEGRGGGSDVNEEPDTQI